MSEIGIKQNQVAHRKELKNLTQKNENELERMRLIHQKRMQGLQAQNKDRVSEVKISNKEKLITVASENEKKLTALQENLQKTKQVLEERDKKIKEDFENVRETRKVTHETALAQEGLKNAMALDDLNHQSQTELNTLRKKSTYLKDELERDNKQEIRLTDSTYKTLKESDKNTFNREYDKNQDKFQQALQKQRFKNIQTLGYEERKNLKNIEQKEMIYSHKLNKLQEDREQKLVSKSAEFEKDFQHIQNVNKDIMQNVLAKREKLLNQLKQDLWDGYQLGAEKADDPFYDFGTIKSSVSESDDKKFYIVEVPTAEHAAENVRLVAEKRTLKIMMDRKHEFVKENDGKKESMNKNESYISYIPVEDIMDSTQISKKYEDGKVIFTVKKA